MKTPLDPATVATILEQVRACPPLEIKTLRDCCDEYYSYLSPLGICLPDSDGKTDKAIDALVAAPANLLKMCESHEVLRTLLTKAQEPKLDLTMDQAIYLRDGLQEVITKHPGADFFSISESQVGTISIEAITLTFPEVPPEKK